VAGADVVELGRGLLASTANDAAGDAEAALGMRREEPVGSCDWQAQAKSRMETSRTAGETRDEQRSFRDRAFFREENASNVVVRTQL
jgi:hypothetical protein